MNIEIQNLTERKIDDDFVKKIIHTTIRFEGRDKDAKIYISVVLVGRARMRVMNRSYRGKNRATDVLSFSGGKNFIMPQKLGEYLGEIIACPQIIEKKALDTGVSFEREFAHTLIHSTLHLLGYEHESREEDARMMHAKEEEIMKRF